MNIKKYININKYGDLAVGIFFFILAVGMFFSANTLPPSLLSSVGADFMPKIVAIVTCALSVLQIHTGFNNMRNYNPESDEIAEEDKPEYMRVLATIVAFTVYVMILGTVGFLLSSIVYLFTQIAILAPKEKRNLLLFAIISIVVCTSVYFIFRFGLNVMLPKGILGY